MSDSGVKKPVKKKKYRLKHKFVVLNRCISIMTAATLLLLTLLPVTAYAKDAIGSRIEIEKVDGKAYVVNASGKKAEARVGVKLSAKESLRTDAGSYAFIGIDDDKVIKIDELSQISIRKTGKKLKVEIEEGNIFFEVKEKLSDDEQMNFGASTMAMSIRGTAGVISLRKVDGNIKTSVELLDGRVDMKYADVTGKAHDFTLWGGESSVHKTGSDSVERDLIDITVLPGFAQEEIAKSPELSDKILKESGLNPNWPKEHWQEKLKEDNSYNYEHYKDVFEKMADTSVNSLEPQAEQIINEGIDNRNINFPDAEDTAKNVRGTEPVTTVFGITQPERPSDTTVRTREPEREEPLPLADNQADTKNSEPEGNLGAVYYDTNPVVDDTPLRLMQALAQLAAENPPKAEESSNKESEDKKSEENSDNGNNNNNNNNNRSSSAAPKKTSSSSSTSMSSSSSSSGRPSSSSSSSTEPKFQYYSVAFYDGTKVLQNTSVQEGKDAVPPRNPEREGYIFTGWDGNYRNVTENTKVYAVFTKDVKYQVDFYDAKSEHPLDPVSTVFVRDGELATAPEYSPKIAGFKFTGWEPDVKLTPITKDTQFYAAYEEIKYYTVTFKDFDGSVLKVIDAVEDGSKVTAPKPPVRAGYEFEYWLCVEDKMVKVDDPVTSNLIFEPVYHEIKSDTYEVNFVDANGSALADTMFVKAGAKVSPPSVPSHPVNPERKFMCWYGRTEGSRTCKWITDPIEGDTTYYGVFGGEEVELSFYDYDGTCIYESVVSRGIIPGNPAYWSPNRPGYRFTGWIGKSIAFDNDFKVTDPVVVSMEFVAQYEREGAEPTATPTPTPVPTSTPVPTPTPTPTPTGDSGWYRIQAYWIKLLYESEEVTPELMELAEMGNDTMVNRGEDISEFIEEEKAIIEANGYRAIGEVIPLGVNIHNITGDTNIYFTYMDR